MTLTLWWAQSSPVPGSPGAAEVVTDATAWFEIALDAAAAGGRLLALWATAGDATSAAGNVRAAFLTNGRLLIATLPIADTMTPYRGLHELYPSAARMQRAAFDLTGIRSDATDQRPWLRHAAWGNEPAPLGPGFGRGTIVDDSVDDYAFIRVDGDGVHEIAVGPVHAGIIEPGHFRFSVVGEKVLRLEQHLGYVHKGIERRFMDFEPREAHRLAARISGDSAVAFSWAYCQALEGLSGITLPARALHLRALALELERLQNHLGDLGALGNDAGFAFGLSQFSRIKETLTRAMHQALGQRYLLDYVIPGGIAQDVDSAGVMLLVRLAREIGGEANMLREIYDEHAGVRDRFVGAGQVTPALARQLGLCGLAGRASGQEFDLRVDQPWAPYDQLGTRKCVNADGDVAARVAVRFDEVQEACVLIARILRGLPAGDTRAGIGTANAPGLAVGLIEGWRGPVLIALDVGANGAIRRCHAHDPSWQNWPVLEHAIIGNIVPDFPLINKSFSLSYSGHDL
jgi:Ni,Fe-hydrogenase III large subunit